MRGTQMARQWKIIRLMETHRSDISGTDLAPELEVPLRPVYRDLDAIQEAGFPLYTEKDGKNSCQLRDYFLDHRVWVRCRGNPTGFSQEAHHAGV